MSFRYQMEKQVLGQVNGNLACGNPECHASKVGCSHLPFGLLSAFLNHKWTFETLVYYCSAAQSCLTLCNPMDCSTPGFPVLSPSPAARSNSCPLSQWCHPTISPSVAPFSSCLQSFPASGSFRMSQLFETLDCAKELLPFMAKASVNFIKRCFSFFNWSVIALQRCIGFHQSFETGPPQKQVRILAYVSKLPFYLYISSI